MEVMKKCDEDVNAEFNRTGESVKAMKDEYRRNGTVSKGGKERGREQGHFHSCLLPPFFSFINHRCLA
jgi:hypothetical protein